MSITYNNQGEVIGVNGLITGQHIGTPMQDAQAAKAEDNATYAVARNVETRTDNSVDLWDDQPVPTGGAESNVMIVMFSNENSCDTPLEDINKALREGKMVFAKDEVATYMLTYFSAAGTIAFTSFRTTSTGTLITTKITYSGIGITYQYGNVKISV